ncbi:helix-turn-helix domain-containing protein [Faecalibaculum rodentium]|uniref:helix-turn-helix domain-containing protein n=1 Tax=Faecalibaculum rodentium TaxID=1702221 RepID=UPI002731E2DB|nr:helix-turn-helix transcriptional regulator [Faecalibaculum rodentium]
MSKQHERIALVRKESGLSKTDFGKKLGIGVSSVTRLETGENNPSERTLKLICSEFRVNFEWLTEGTGEMYSRVGNTLLEMLVDEYNLTDLDRSIMEMYLKLTDEQRGGIRAFVQGMIDAGNKKQGQ